MRDQPVCPPSDRAAFLRDNAVAVVSDRDRLIERLRKQVRRLERSSSSRKRKVSFLRETLLVVEPALARAAKMAALLHDPTDLERDLAAALLPVRVALAALGVTFSEDAHA